MRSEIFIPSPVNLINNKSMGLFNRKKKVAAEVELPNTFKDYADVRKNAEAKIGNVATTESGKRYKCTKLITTPVWESCD